MSARSWISPYRRVHVPLCLLLAGLLAPWPSADAQPSQGAPAANEEAIERIYEQLLAEERERGGNDRVELVNGTILRGAILADDSDTIRFKTQENIATSIPRSRVRSIQRGVPAEIPPERKIQLRAEAERIHRELHGALAAPVSLDFTGTQFSAITQFIHAQTGVRIALDPGLGRKAITVKMNQVPLRLALETMATQAGGRVEIGTRQVRIVPADAPTKSK